MEYYIFRDKQFEIKEEDKDKYIVVACAKQENDYIIEWVEHYLKLGFDKIFIADNNDMGDDSLEILLKDYTDKNLVEIFDLRGYETIQREFYNMFSQRGNYKWCAYFDCDEFLELNAHDNIKIFLYECHPNDNLVSFNWVMYGNNNEIEKNNLRLQEKYIHPLPLISTVNFTIKTMLNGNYKVEYEVHNIKGGLWEKPIDYREGYIKHYKFKSVEEQVLFKNKTDVYYHDLEKIKKQRKCRIFDEEKYFLLLKNIHSIKSISKGEGRNFEKYDTIIYNVNVNRYGGVIDSIICDMLLNKNKFFVLKENKGKVHETEFNILFEYALHTQNKITLRMPSLSKGYRYINFNFN